MNKQDWTYKTFGEVFDLQMGRTPDRKNPSLFGGDNIWVSIRDIDGKYIEDSKEHITNEAVVNSGIKLVKKGTVIMSFKLTVGKCAIARKDLYTNEAIMAFNVNKGFILDSSFLYYYLQGYRWSGTNKAVMGLTLNKATISKQKIAIPPIGEQERIVAELDLLQGIIEKKKEQLKAYDQLAQSIFYTMFGDPIDNPKGWEKKDLKTICSKITDGTHDTPERLNSGVKFITGKHIRPFFIDFDNSDYVTEEVHKEIFLRCNPELGDVLYTNIGAGIGNAALNTVEYEFSMKNVALIKPKKSVVNGYFIEYYLNDEDIKSIIIDNYSNGGAQKFLSLKSIAKIPIFVPPLSLQEEFAEKVEAIERQKALVQQSIEETQTMFDYTMDKYFG